MIPRLLVPKDARPVASSSDAPPPRRLSSDLDERTLVPSNLPHIELDGHTSIPAYRPLDVLGSRTVIPRDMPSTALDATTKIPDYAPPSILNSRVAVPSDAHPELVETKKYVPTWDLPDVLDRDVLNTGEVNLMTQPVEEKTSAAWNAVARTASIAFHFVVLLLILFSPKLFPYKPPTDEEIARQKAVTDVFLPSYLSEAPKAAPVPPQPKPQVRVDPRILNKIAPPREVQPTPNPPEVPAPSKSLAPMPQPQPQPQPQPRSQPPVDSPMRPQPQAPTPNIVLPRISPGKSLEDSMHEVLRSGGGAPSVGFSEPVGPAPGGAVGGGGGGSAGMGGGLQMLTPTEGVDFSGYLARVLASVKRNWYAVMPESAMLGERGKVVLQFRIMRNGVVPDAEPQMMLSSSKEPLDRAAHSAIRASTPFEPLPSAFSGPYIELRFTFLYNLPLDTQ